jgi:hypothetical protein
VEQQEEIIEPISQAAAVSSSIPDSGVSWWLAAIALAALSAAAIYLAKRISKNEWRIEDGSE